MNDKPKLPLLRLSLKKIKKVINLYISTCKTKKDIDGFEEEDFYDILDSLNSIEDKINHK